MVAREETSMLETRTVGALTDSNLEVAFHYSSTPSLRELLVTAVSYRRNECLMITETAKLHSSRMIDVSIENQTKHHLNSERT